MPLLSQQTLRRLLALATLTLLSATLALAQEPASTIGSKPAAASEDNWTFAQSFGSPKRKLFVATKAHPKLRHGCHVQSFTLDQIVCRDDLAVIHTYKRENVAAVILAGDSELRARVFIGANAALGAAIWGTIVLAPVCPPCAAATAFGAFVAFAVGGVTGYTDDVPDRLLYLAPGQPRRPSYG